MGASRDSPRRRHTHDESVAATAARAVTAQAAIATTRAQNWTSETPRGSIMFKKPNCPVIAIEEHYWDPELTKHYTGSESGRGGDMDQRLYDLGSLRLKEMDEAGIDIQVISH